MASRVAALLLLGVLCFGFASAVITDCCLTAVDKRLPSKHIVDYAIQEAGKGCDISATVFITSNGKALCVVHVSEKQWVRQLINIVKQKKKAQE